MFNQNISREQLEELAKALSTNDFAKLQGPANQRGGAALIPESLENSLRALTFTEDNLKLWKDIPKQQAYSTVEEYNVINSYGEDISGFQREGLAGVNTTGDYSREIAKMKIISTTREVTHLLSHLVDTQPNAMEVATKSAMRWILGQTEQALFYGDDELAPDNKEGLEWAGILKQADEGNTIDMRGKYLDDNTLNEASARIMDNYGVASKIYMPINVAKTFSEQYYPDQRALMNVQAGTVTAGTLVTQFNSIGGNVQIEPDVFMRKGLQPLDPQAEAVGNNAPTPPTVEAELNSEEVEGNETEFDEGTYKYAVVAVNATGRSVPVETDAVAMTADAKLKGVKLTITNSDVQLEAPEFFVIYRTEKDGNKLYEIGRIGAKSTKKSAVTEFIDTNETLPNTGVAIIGDFRTEETIGFKQIAPMFKLDYALISPVHRFGVFLHGAPVLYMPKRFAVIKNIGQESFK